MLYIVGTPIGNLEDMSFRAIRVLGEADYILCEDTRVTKVLLNHYNIKTPTISCHQHSDEKKINYILDLLEQGKTLAMVSDAGTPGISDPGGKLVQAVIERFGDDIKIEAVPGPSAVTAALSISGIPTDKFIFFGFPPHKKGRQTFIRKIISSEFPVVVYESKHRILKFLEELEIAANDPGQGKLNQEDGLEKIKNYKIARPEPVEGENSKITSVVVCRELSKMHETVYRGDVRRVIERIKSDMNDQRGEFTVIIGR